MSANIRYVTAQALPELARMPKTGRCQWTGLCRSTLEQLDRDGLVRLIRIVRPGKKRGIVMIPVQEVLDFIRKQDRKSTLISDRSVGGGKS